MTREAPLNYRVQARPDWVQTCNQPGFIQTIQEHKTERQKIGLRYERKVQWKLNEIYGLNYISSQWWKYEDQGRLRFCQTDGLLLEESRQLLIIVEIKYNHTTDAYFQLENVYVPILKTFLKHSPWQIATVEIVKWFDPSVHYPKRPVLIPSLQLAKPGNFSVHILSP